MQTEYSYALASSGVAGDLAAPKTGWQMPFSAIIAVMRTSYKTLLQYVGRYEVFIALIP